MSITSTISPFSQANEVVAVTFNDVEDFRDCKQYWSASGHGGWWGKNKNAYSTLKDALINHTAQALRDGPVYSDVVMFIEENLYYKNSLVNGAIEKYASEMETLHQQYFQSNLYKERRPHYLIVPKKGLSATTVEFYFGNYVFVPDENDTLRYTVKIQKGHPTIPANWEAARNIVKSTPLGIYDTQEGFCLGGGLTPNLEAKNLWNNNKCLYIDTNRIDNNTIIFGIKPTFVLNTDNETVLQFNERDMIDRPNNLINNNAALLQIDKTPPIPDNPHESIISTNQQENAQSRQEANDSSVILIFTPVGMQNEQKVAHDTSENSDQTKEVSNEKEDWTITPTPKNASKASEKALNGTITIEAFLLPRLDKKKLGDVVSWRLWFDKNGHLLKKQGGEYLTLAADNTLAQLYIKEHDQATFSPCIQEYFFGDLCINPCTVPRTLQDDFLAYLYLDTFSQISLVENNSVTIGRGSLNGPNNDIQLLLNFMRVQQSLKSGNGSLEENFDRLHTSGKHVSAVLMGNMLHIKQLSTKTPIYVLNETGQVAHQLAAVTPASPNNPLAIEDGGRFIVGCYLLRFEAPRVATNNNDTDGTITFPRAHSKETRETNDGHESINASNQNVPTPYDLVQGHADLQQALHKLTNLLYDYCTETSPTTQFTLDLSSLAKWIRDEAYANINTRKSTTLVNSSHTTTRGCTLIIDTRNLIMHPEENIDYHQQQRDSWQGLRGGLERLNKTIFNPTFYAKHRNEIDNLADFLSQNYTASL